MTLTWNRHDHILGTMCAVGLRGEYTAEPSTNLWWLHAANPSTILWWLSATGHDGLPMPGIPHIGIGFTDLTSAQACAEQLDHAAAEAQISGS